MRIEPLGATFGHVLTPSGARESLPDLGTGRIRELLADRRGGMILFRGFDATERAFHDFTKAHGRKFLIHHNVEGRDYIGPDRSFATVAKSQRPIDFHLEMASNPVKPKVLWFYCVAPALRNGRIGFADGGAVLDKLTRRTRDRLQEGLVYRYQGLPPAIWQPVWGGAARSCAVTTAAALMLRVARRMGSRNGVSSLTLDAQQNLSFSYQVACIFRSEFSGVPVCASGLLDNAHRTLLGTGELVPQDVVIEVAQATYQNAVWIDWRAGDIAVLDNTRILHAREAFEDSQRRVLVRYSVGFRAHPAISA
jgi:alpha-ketoglutarate-dependent taurine dioxygenase